MKKIVTQFCYFKKHLPGFMFVSYGRFNLERKEKLKTKKTKKKKKFILMLTVILSVLVFFLQFLNC